MAASRSPTARAPASAAQRLGPLERRVTVAQERLCPAEMGRRARASPSSRAVSPSAWANAARASGWPVAAAISARAAAQDRASLSAPCSAQQVTAQCRTGTSSGAPRSPPTV